MLLVACPAPRPLTGAAPGSRPETLSPGARPPAAAYKKTALECHPDKALAGVEDEAERERVEAHFLLVQEAQEHLSDPVKRREFDSIDEFDDSLPESCAPEDYFKVRGPGARCAGFRV